MGGSGSGRWNYYQKKRTSEECWTLDVADLYLAAISTSGPRASSGRLGSIGGGVAYPSVTPQSTRGRT